MSVTGEPNFLKVNTNTFIFIFIISAHKSTNFEKKIVAKLNCYKISSLIDVEHLSMYQGFIFLRIKCR